MGEKVAVVPGLPMGYRFLPSSDVLIRNYLLNKNLSKALPLNVIPDIHANQFYSMPPYLLVANTPCTIEKEWYYFVRDDSYFRGEKKEEIIVGNGDGFWRGDDDENPNIDTDNEHEIWTCGKKKEEISVGNRDRFWRGDDDENPIINTEDVIGFRKSYRYFTGPIADPMKTEWKLEKYRLPYKCEATSEGQKEGWVVGRIIKGNGYDLTD